MNRKEKEEIARLDREIEELTAKYENEKADIIDIIQDTFVSEERDRAIRLVIEAKDNIRMEYDLGDLIERFGSYERLELALKEAIRSGYLTRITPATFKWEYDENAVDEDDFGEDDGD